MAIITLTIARPRADCGSCEEGVPDVSNEVPVTPPPSDECASGELDVTGVTGVTTDPPPC